MKFISEKNEELLISSKLIIELNITIKNLNEEIKSSS